MLRIVRRSFVRRHFSKRQEGFDSDDKCFVCQGTLHSTPTAIWGCGRRFDRIDELRKHFSSEAGQECIKLLIDEEGFLADKELPHRLPSSLFALYPDLRQFELSQECGERSGIGSRDEHDNSLADMPNRATVRSTGKGLVFPDRFALLVETPAAVATQHASAVKSETEQTKIHAGTGLEQELSVIETPSPAAISTPPLWTDEGYFTLPHSRQVSSMSECYSFLDLEPGPEPERIHDPAFTSYISRSLIPASPLQVPAIEQQIKRKMLEPRYQQLLCSQYSSSSQPQDYVGGWTDRLEPNTIQSDLAKASFPLNEPVGLVSGDGNLKMSRLELDPIPANVPNNELLSHFRGLSLSRWFDDRTRQHNAENSISSVGEISFIGSIDSNEATELWERELPSCLQNVRGKLVHQLLVMYREALVEDSSEQPLDCGDTSPSSQRTSAATSSSDGATRSSVTSLGKHPRDDGDISSNNGLQSPDHKKKRTSASMISLDGRLLACPYNKIDPSRYSEVNTEEKNYRGCSSCYLTTISRLKQHLYRVHKRPDHYCACCFKIFESKESLDTHARSRSCEVQDPQFSEKMNFDQVTLIRRRAVGQDQSETWFAIFEILFPGTPRPQSAYADSVSPEMVQRFVDHFNRQARGRLLELIRVELGGRMLMDNDQQRILDSALENALAQLVSADDPTRDHSEPQSAIASPQASSSPPSMDPMDQYHEATQWRTNSPEVLLSSHTLQRTSLVHERSDASANLSDASTSQQSYPVQQYLDSDLIMGYTNYSLPNLPENDFFNNNL